MVLDLTNLYYSNYNELTRGQKAQLTKLIRRLKNQRQQALDEIFSMACDIADSAASEQVPNEKQVL